MLFVGCLLLLSFASTTRYSKTADLALIGLRLALLVLLSTLALREQWKRYRHLQGSSVHSKLDAGDTALRRVRRWFYDEPEHHA
jgi:hypothetical protein